MGAMHFELFQGRESGQQPSKEMGAKVIPAKEETTVEGQRPDIATDHGGRGKKMEERKEGVLSFGLDIKGPK